MARASRAPDRRAKMARLFVKADKEGQILAVAKVDSLREGQKDPFSVDDPKIEVIEITDAKEKAKFMKMEVVDIHQGYSIDIRKKVLEKKIQSFLQLSCDAPDFHPVDGIPEISADGESFTTITAQKIDESGEPQQGNKDNDLLYLRTDYGTLFGSDGKAEISSIKLKRGQAAFRLVSEKARRVATVQVFNADANLMDHSIRIEFI
jgi:hypothetical protein